MTDPHTEALIAAKLQRVEVLEVQQAQHGILTPPHIMVELNALRREIASLQYQRTQLIFQANHLDLEPPPLAQGLLLLVSPLEKTKPLHSLGTYQAIDYHRATLRRCWLIATDGPAGSLATAEALARHFGVYHVQSTIHTVANGADAAETLALVTAIYTQIAQDGALEPASVIADITAGTKAMTAGMVLACGTIHRMQYMLYQKGIPSSPVLLRMHYP
jgi:hypothetical protein